MSATDTKGWIVRMSYPIKPNAAKIPITMPAIAPLEGFSPEPSPSEVAAFVEDALAATSASLVVACDDVVEVVCTKGMCAVLCVVLWIGEVMNVVGATEVVGGGGGGRGLGVGLSAGACVARVVTILGVGTGASGVGFAFVGVGSTSDSMTDPRDSSAEKSNCAATGAAIAESHSSERVFIVG